MTRTQNTRIILDKDKIIVNGRLHDGFNFERNPLGSVTPLSINYNKLQHTNEIVDKGSKFQGHKFTVLSANQAIAARNALYQNPELATATHIMYAYRFGTQGESVQSEFSDDSEIGGGKILMELLDDNETINTFISVTRIKKGPNIGPARFRHIQTCANDALSAIDEEEDESGPTFNQIKLN